MRKRLAGKVALVAGATRGAGRGIARALGEAGATVYCTGRSSRRDRRAARTRGAPFALDRRPETIEETAELVAAAGGVGRAVKVDHTDPRAVARLVARIRREAGRLDVLVDDIWGGDELTEWGKPVEALDLGKGLRMIERGLFTHLITARLCAPLLLATKGSLLVEVTDGDRPDYRMNLFYDTVKAAVVRLGFGLAEELGPRGVTVVTVTPGFLRSEAVLEHFGVGAADWREAGAKDPNFLASETPGFVGRAIAALAADPRRKRWAGKLLSSWGLSRVYGFEDMDGGRPDWGAHRDGRGLDPATRKLLAAMRESGRRFLGIFPG